MLTDSEILQNLESNEDTGENSVKSWPIKREIDDDAYYDPETNAESSFQGRSSVERDTGNNIEDAADGSNDNTNPVKKRTVGPKKYTQVQLQLAYEACQNGMTQYRACKLYGVPRGTLAFRLQRKMDDLAVRAGPKGYLTKAEELPIVDRLHALADAGFLLSYKQVSTFAGEYVKVNQALISTKNPFPVGIPGRSWTACFFKRHPALAERTLENWACYGLVGVSQEGVANWFGCATRYLEKMGIQTALQERQQVFTVDDVSFSIARNATKVTCLFGASAYGNLLPPLVLYPQGEKLPSMSSKLNYPVAHEDTEDTTGNALYEWLSKVFQPWLIEENVPRPVILFVDGHRVQMGYRSSEFCKQHQIIFISLLPRSDRIPRLLESKLFVEMGKLWRAEVKKVANIKSTSVHQLLNSVLNQLKDSSSNTIREAFYQSNIFPWNPPYQSIPPQPVRKAPPRQRKNAKPLPARQPIDPMLSLFRRMLESRLTPEQLVRFQAQRGHGDPWQGPVEETCLFQIWRDLQDEIDIAEPSTVPPLDANTGGSAIGAMPGEEELRFEVEMVAVKQEDHSKGFLVKEEPGTDSEDL